MTLQFVWHCPTLGAHSTASIAPQRLAGAPCSPVCDLFMFLISFRIFVYDYSEKIERIKSKTALNHFFFEQRIQFYFRYV